MSLTEFVNGLIGCLDAEAPDSLLSDLQGALRSALNVDHAEPPLSAIEIVEAQNADIEALLYFEILLSKNNAAEFLINIGYKQSEVTIKRDLLRRGRYFERFGRQLLTHKKTNIFTYAELIDMIDRALIKERWYEVIESLNQ